MKKIAALLLGLALISFNVFAAVNVNTATEEQLQTLNGIGPAKAKAIVDYRTAHGSFKSVEELDNVPGIGPATMEKIRGDVTLTGPTTVKEKEKSKPAEKAESKKTATAKPAAPPAAATKAEPTQPATAAPAAKAETAQQEKMKDCNAQASKQKLKGDDRKTFMKSCLSGTTQATQEKKLTPQQQKMEDCNAQAKSKKLTGDDRKKFMKTCLSAK